MNGTREFRISKWTLSRGKRCFDFILALGGTVLLLPLMGTIALAVRVTSGSPVLFTQFRCGRLGKPFRLFKFRSMRSTVVGSSITSAGDTRITNIGRFLRNWKLDELPQLFNVLRGELSLVGPRPELPEYIAELGSAGQDLLELKPGITGWATLQYRNEEELLASVPAEELREYYVAMLLPKKAALDLEYASRATLLSDVALLLKTCLATVWVPAAPVASHQEITGSHRAQ